MRGNVLQTWTAASLLAIGLLTAGAATTYGFRSDPAEPRGVPMSWARIEHCAAPAPSRVRSPEVGSRQAAAMLLLLMGERARLDGGLR